MYDYPNIMEKPEPTTAYATGFAPFDRTSVSPDYRDLRPFQDDRRILRRIENMLEEEVQDGAGEILALVAVAVNVVEERVMFVVQQL
ncbi:MAG: hypothetical protein J6D10_08005, partial [Clostridia bacterium]|nr:hypothetical protein [Clostridia bacterium]